MKSLDEIKSIIAGRMEEMQRRYGVCGIEIFGSYVRGEQKKDSDLDVLVEFDRPVDLLEVVGLEMFLSEALQIKTDVVLKRSIRPELKDIILGEAVPV
jgi:predicted nucleotidyltransferase